MHVERRHIVAFALVCAFAAFTRGSAAQQAIPIRPLGPIHARSAEAFGATLALRGLPGGKVLINDPQSRRLWLYDSTFAKIAAVADTAVGTAVAYAPRGAGLIPFTGDSSYLVDAASVTMLVVSPSGKVGRATAIPKPADLQFLIPAPAQPFAAPSNGAPAFDAKGRLIYRSNFRVPPRPPPTNGQQASTPPDTAPLVRVDFETNVVDTLATYRIPFPGTQRVENAPSGPKMSLTIMVFAPNDEWAVLSDGTVAIVRAQDYHIDWIDPDGTKRSTPKMPFDWRRLTDDDKKMFADSALASFNKIVDSLMKVSPPLGGMRPTISVVPLNEIPDYLPPIGAVRADLDGNLWILPTTSLAARNGRLYDVVNRKGEIIERVQFPEGRTLEGFGPGGIVYLSLRVDGRTYLERARIR